VRRAAGPGGLPPGEDPGGRRFPLGAGLPAGRAPADAPVPSSA